MAGKSLPVSLPVLWPGTCSKSFHKTNENSDYISETFECSVDNLPGRHLSHGKLARGNYDVEGHIDFRTAGAGSGVCNKLSKTCFESFSSDSISGCRNRFPQYDSVPSDTKERTDHFTMPGSIESIRCLIKANDSIDRASFINSNSCSSSTFAVPIFATSTNSRVSREEKLQCTGSVIKRSEGGNSVVDIKPDAVQRETSNLTSPSIDHNFRCLSSGLGAASQGQTTEGPWTAEEQKHHINILELKAAKLAILTFIRMHPEVKSIHLQTDDIVGLSYIVKMGGTHNKVLSDISKEIWDFLLLKEITITIEYLPGVLNQEADFQSRSMKDSSEWKLKLQIFRALCNLRGTPDIDLFASRVSHQLLCYISWKLDPFSKGRDAFQRSYK